MNYNYSYSGADCDVYAVYEEVIIHLDSIATVSVSMYEAKAPVRRLGHASPVGFTGNIRSIAGSLIFIVKNEHPLGEVMKMFPRFSKHIDDDITQKGFDRTQDDPEAQGVFNAGMIEPFKLMLMYKNEVDARGAGLRINNLEFISEGIVTSVNDIVSEVVLQFVATDIDQLELEKQKTEPKGKERKRKTEPLKVGFFYFKIPKTNQEGELVYSSARVPYSEIYTIAKTELNFSIDRDNALSSLQELFNVASEKASGIVGVFKQTILRYEAGKNSDLPDRTGGEFDPNVYPYDFNSSSVSDLTSNIVNGE